MNLHRHIIIIQRPQLILGVTFIVEFYGLGKYVTRIHHYYTIIYHTIWRALKICAPPIYPSFPSTADLFTVSINLPFPECLIVGIIQYTAFSDWLLFLCNLHWSFFCIFSWLHSLKALNHIPSSGCTRVYLFIYLLKDILMVTKFWQLRISCYTDFMVV